MSATPAYDVNFRLVNLSKILGAELKDPLMQLFDPDPPPVRCALPEPSRAQRVLNAAIFEARCHFCSKLMGHYDEYTPSEVEFVCPGCVARAERDVAAETDDDPGLERRRHADEGAKA